MPNYVLSAADDSEAALEGVLIVLKRAQGSNLWSKGRIVLVDQTGRIVQEMPRKD